MAQASSTNRQPALRKFFLAGRRHELSRGEIIIRPEDHPKDVFYIKDGFVKSFDITKYGEENLLVIRKSGQMFPVLWTMIHERTNVYYQTMSDAVLYSRPMSEYQEEMEHDSDFAQQVLEQVLTMYRIHSRRVQNLVFRTAPERIAFRLLVLSDRFGEATNNGVLITAPTRRQDIAESVNCSRETASREISKLEKKNVIKTIDGNVYIKDFNTLMNMVGAEESMRNRFSRFLNLH